MNKPVLKSSWHPDVTVAAICEHNGKFLMVEEKAKSSGRIVFNQPAGHIEDNESIIDGVIRESLEETCRHFTPEYLVGLYRLRLNNERTYIRYTFAGSISDIDPNATLDSDIIDTHWMDLATLQAHAQLRSPIVLQCVNDYLSGSLYPLDMLKER